MKRIITQQLKQQFIDTLYKEEKNKNTIEKYLRDIEKLEQYLSNRCITKEEVINFKEDLQKHYKISSVNSFLAAINHFFEVVGWQDLKIKSLKVQKQIFSPEERYLTKREYKRLISTAMETGKERIALILRAGLAIWWNPVLYPFGIYGYDSFLRISRIAVCTSD